MPIVSMTDARLRFRSAVAMDALFRCYHNCRDDTGFAGVTCVFVVGPRGVHWHSCWFGDHDVVVAFVVHLDRVAKARWLVPVDEMPAACSRAAVSCACAVRHQAGGTN